MWRVDLSEVRAKVEAEGEKAREKMAAWSTPRRNSAILVHDGKDQRRMRVPCSLAVAMTSSVRLMAMARRGESCAGMMLMFAVVRSNSLTCPIVLPGKATMLLPNSHNPYGLFAVS